MRTFLAGLAASLVMFIWTSIAHMALPLGATGVSTLPNESATVAALQANIGEHEGLFLFPSTMTNKSASPEGASGFLVYHPHAALVLQPSNLVREYLTELTEAMIAAVLLSWALIDGYLPRVGFVSLLGLAAAVTTNISYWNWYGFPTSYTLAYAFTEFFGFVVSGLVIAAMLPARK